MTEMNKETVNRYKKFVKTLTNERDKLLKIESKKKESTPKDSTRIDQLNKKIEKYQKLIDFKK